MPYKTLSIRHNKDYQNYKYYTNNSQLFKFLFQIKNHGDLMTPRQDWNEESIMRRYRDSMVEGIRFRLMSDEAEPPRGCPECGAAEYVHYGRTAKGTERFRCKECGRTFTPKHLMSGSQIPEEKWMAFAECYVDKVSIRRAADLCGVSTSTTYRMKCRIDGLMGADAEDDEDVLCAPSTRMMDLRAIEGI